MDRFLVGGTITVKLPLADSAGNVVVPTALSYVVYDEAGAERVTETAIVGPFPANEITIALDPTVNDVVGARELVLTITWAGGVYQQSAAYELFQRVTLDVPTRSFQTLLQAMMLARDVPNQLGWIGADNAGRETALVEAHARLTQLEFLIPPDEIDDQSHMSRLLGFDRIKPTMWPVMQSQTFLQYPASFRLALCKAQIAEANEILRGDTIADKRRAGLMSETIGESSMMFRPGPRPLDRGASRAAMAYLQLYVVSRTIIGRA